MFLCVHMNPPGFVSRGLEPNRYVYLLVTTVGVQLCMITSDARVRHDESHDETNLRPFLNFKKICSMSHMTLSSFKLSCHCHGSGILHHISANESSPPARGCAADKVPLDPGGRGAARSSQIPALPRCPSRRPSLRAARSSAPSTASAASAASSRGVGSSLTSWRSCTSTSRRCVRTSSALDACMCHSRLGSDGQLGRLGLTAGLAACLRACVHSQTNAECCAYLWKYDSAHGVWPHEVCSQPALR
eukprot:SAG22_NODE_78_length_22065_cov_7.473095_2_plen_246_part_00